MSLIGMDFDADKTKANVKIHLSKIKKFNYETFVELAQQLKINR